MLVTRTRSTLAPLTSGLVCSLLISFAANAGTLMPSSDDRAMPASLPQDIISSRSAITSTQKGKIDDYVGQLTEILVESDSNSPDLTKARDLLIQSTRLAGVTPVFLRTYSDIVIEKVEPLVFGDDALKSENALRVVAFLQTPQALGLLVETLDTERNKDASRRLVAAGLLPVAIAPGAKSNLDSAGLANSARNIALSVRGETDWVVVLEELRALNKIALNPILADQNRAEIRTIQFETYKSIADRIASSATPSDMIFAIHRAMLSLRTQLISNSTASDFDVARAAKLLEGILTEIAEGSVKQWSELEKKPRYQKAYEASLKIGSQLLSLLKSSSAPAFAKLNEAFANGPEALQTTISKLP